MQEDLVQIRSRALEKTDPCDHPAVHDLASIWDGVPPSGSLGAPVSDPCGEVGRSGIGNAVRASELEEGGAGRDCHCHRGRDLALAQLITSFSTLEYGTQRR